MWKTLLALAWASVSAVGIAGPKSDGRLLALATDTGNDTAPTVLQNRFFTKQLRLETGVSAGTILNESYSNTSSFGGRVGLFLSEKIGVEYNYAKFKAADSPDLLALRKQEVCVALECRSIEPSYIRLSKSHQLQLVTAPIYGKINLFDWLILYSDLTLSAGAARVETTQGQKWALTPGIGQRFYFSRSFSLRIDATDVFLRQTVSNGETSLSSWRHNWVAQFGLSAFLNSGD